MATFDNSALLNPGNATDGAAISREEEQVLLSQLHKQEKPKAAFGHMKTLDPSGRTHKTAKKHSTHQEPKGISPEAQTLARNNDRNIESLAREANKPKTNDDGEVVVSLR
jgi:hypothetical protein